MNKMPKKNEVILKKLKEVILKTPPAFYLTDYWMFAVNSQLPKSYRTHNKHHFASIVRLLKKDKKFKVETKQKQMFTFYKFTIDDGS